MQPPPARRTSEGVIAAPVYCRRCGYNLYGLFADGACPECGLDTWETIIHTVDPAASRLPKLRNAQAVGGALLWLTICLLVGAVLVVVPPLAIWLEDLDPRGLIDLAAWARPEFAAGSAIAAIVGLWSAWRLAPPIGEEANAAVWREVWFLAGGLAGWGVLAATMAGLRSASALVAGLLWLGLAAAAIVTLLGLRGVLRTIGFRSREYRTARGGRQGIRAMVAAIIGIAAAQALNLVLGEYFGVRYLEDVWGAVTAIGTLMVIVGLAYLVMNAWWIRRSLRCPPPTLEEILRVPDA